MPVKQSAGTLLYRPLPESLEVLLVHPSGPYNRRAPWSIPKGLPDPGESLEAAAPRDPRRNRRQCGRAGGTGVHPVHQEP